MADKKDSHDSGGSNSTVNSFEIIFFIVFFLGIIIIVTDWINKNHDTLSSFFNTLLFNLINFFAKYVVFAFFLSIVLIILL